MCPGYTGAVSEASWNSRSGAPSKLDPTSRRCSVLRPWLLGAVAIACGLLLAVWGIAAASMADPTTTLLPGLNLPADADALTHIMLRNSLVLLLHALACVAGFIAGASLPLQAEYKTGLSRLNAKKTCCNYRNTRICA